MKALVRRATSDDLAHIAPLFDAYRQFYRQRSDPNLARDFIGARLAQHESVIFLGLAGTDPADRGAHEREEGVGFCQLYPSFSSVRAVRTFVLNDLFVAPSARRLGLGAQLLAAATQFARAAGAESISLSTASDNVAAQSLYERSGWQRQDGFFEYRFGLQAVGVA